MSIKSNLIVVFCWLLIPGDYWLWRLLCLQLALEVKGVQVQPTCERHAGRVSDVVSFLKSWDTMTMTMMVTWIVTNFSQMKAGAAVDERVWNATAHADQGLKVVIDRNFDRYCIRTVQFRADYWQFNMLKASLPKALAHLQGERRVSVYWRCRIQTAPRPGWRLPSPPGLSSSTIEINCWTYQKSRLTMSNYHLGKCTAWEFMGATLPRVKITQAGNFRVGSPIVSLSSQDLPCVGRRST